MSRNPPSLVHPQCSISATNNLAYVLARDALHTLAAAARQAPMCISGTGLKFKDPSRRAMHAGDVSSEASTQVINPPFSFASIRFNTAPLDVKHVVHRPQEPNHVCRLVFRPSSLPERF